MKFFQVEKIRKMLDFESKINVFETVTSTNDVAFSLGGIVVSETQTCGRGRRGRSFFSGEGGLYLSIALDLSGDAVVFSKKSAPFSAGRLTIAAGIAVAKALLFYGANVSVKWVNDVYRGDKKICGILAELRGETVVVGMGINVNSAIPNELKDKAASLEMDVDMNELAARVINGFYTEFTSPDIEFLNRHCLTIGKTVSSALGTGTAVGIDGDGALMVRIGDKTERIYYGEANIVD